MSLEKPFPCCEHCNFFHINSHLEACAVPSCMQRMNYEMNLKFDERMADVAKQFRRPF